MLLLLEKQSKEWRIHLIPISVWREQAGGTYANTREKGFIGKEFAEKLKGSIEQIKQKNGNETQQKQAPAHETKQEEKQGVAKEEKEGESVGKEQKQRQTHKQTQKPEGEKEQPLPILIVIKFIGICAKLI